MTQDNDNEPSSSNSSSSSSSSSHNIPISSTSKAKIHVPASSTQDVQHMVSIVKALTKKVDNLQNFQSGLPIESRRLPSPKPTRTSTYTVQATSNLGAPTPRRKMTASMPTLSGTYTTGQTYYPTSQPVYIPPPQSFYNPTTTYPSFPLQMYNQYPLQPPLPLGPPPPVYRQENFGVRDIAAQRAFNVHGSMAPMKKSKKTVRHC